MSANQLANQTALVLGRDELNAKFRSGSPRILRASQLLATAAKSDDVLYRIRAGWAYRFRDLSDGSRAILDVYLPGDVIGLDTGLRECTASVRTLTTTAIEVISAARGLSEVIESRNIALYLARLVGERRQRTDDLLAAISCLDARGRIAAMVLDFYRRLESQKLITAFSFNLPLTQNHIGSYLGVTVVHVNRVIRSLQDMGIVNIEKHFVTIHDLLALAALAKTRFVTAAAADSAHGDLKDNPEVSVRSRGDMPAAEQRATSLNSSIIIYGDSHEATVN
jgi:CRP/FNR family transcriptional regulator, anaerobic regulatory protein